MPFYFIIKDNKKIRKIVKDTTAKSLQALWIYGYTANEKFNSYARNVRKYSAFVTVAIIFISSVCSNIK